MAKSVFTLTLAAFRIVPLVASFVLTAMAEQARAAMAKVPSMPHLKLASPSVRSNSLQMICTPSVCRSPRLRGRAQRRGQENAPGRPNGGPGKAFRN